MSSSRAGSLGKASQILVIDDDAVFREAVRRRLLRAGYGVTVAADAQEGLQQAIAATFDVILLDLTMPGLSGEEVIRVLRPLGLRSKIVAISANSDDGWKSRMRDLGAVTAFEKPVRFDDLLSFLDRVTTSGSPGAPAGSGFPPSSPSPFWDRILPLVFTYPDSSGVQKAVALGIALAMGLAITWLLVGKRI